MSKSICDMPMPALSDIIKAKKNLEKIVKRTDLERSKSFSNMVGAQVYLKLENLQSTGSFKIRGAYNHISRLSPEDKERGVLCASAGNHAQGVAYAATKLGVKSTIFMPEFAPPIKVIATRGYGANVILKGGSLQGSERAVTSGHEVFGHGIPAAKKLTPAENNANAIRTDNLIRRILGLPQRDDSNHGGYKEGHITNPYFLPILK